MQLENVKGVTPTGSGVLVDVHEVTKEKNGIFIGEDESVPTDIKMYFGTVEKVGPDATNQDACPGLKEGDVGFFSEFSGYNIASRDETPHKLIPAYDIMAIITDTKKLSADTITPTADRILISVKFLDQSESGVVLTAEDASDPRLRDLDYGKVLQQGPSTKLGFKTDCVVAYDPYAGEKVRPASGKDSPELRLIREDDILFVIK